MPLYLNCPCCGSSSSGSGGCCPDPPNTLTGTITAVSAACLGAQCQVGDTFTLLLTTRTPTSLTYVQQGTGVCALLINLQCNLGIWTCSSGSIAWTPPTIITGVTCSPFDATITFTSVAYPPGPCQPPSTGGYSCTVHITG